jgi:hypothetical protein
MWVTSYAPGPRQVLGGAAFVFGVLALVTGSLTALSLLVADMVLMWALTTLRHAHSPPGRPVTR